MDFLFIIIYKAVVLDYSICFFFFYGTKSWLVDTQCFHEKVLSYPLTCIFYNLELWHAPICYYFCKANFSHVEFFLGSYCTATAQRKY